MELYLIIEAERARIQAFDYFYQEVNVGLESNDDEGVPGCLNQIRI